MKIYNAKIVLINNKKYRVEKHLFSPVRGHEYLISSSECSNERMCIAKRKGTKTKIDNDFYEFQ
jgi:hypothetical protein